MGASINDPKELINLLKHIDTISKENQKIIFDFLFEKYDIKKLLTKMIDVFKISDEHKNIINEMILKSDFRILLILNMVKPFSADFGKIKRGHTLLTCAQIAVRKNYTFDPVILDPNELEPYLNALIQHAHENLRARFILCGPHWRVGDIEFKNGAISALLIDSIGLDEKNDQYRAKDLLNILATRLTVGDTVPMIYFDPTKRQYSGVGCSAFSTDDLQHLFTLEKYLGCSLFDYFKNQHSVKSIPIDDQTDVQQVGLPLSLMRTAQSRKLITDIIPSRDLEEVEKPVNKRNQTAGQSVSHFF